MIREGFTAMTSEEIAQSAYIAELQLRLAESRAEVAEYEPLYTAALVDLHRALDELEAMRRTAGALADEKGGIASDLLEAQLEVNRLRAAQEETQADAAVLRDLFYQPTGPVRTCILCRAPEPRHYPGCALLLRDAGLGLLTELEAARSLIAHLSERPARSADDYGPWAERHVALLSAYEGVKGDG